MGVLAWEPVMKGVGTDREMLELAAKAAGLVGGYAEQASVSTKESNPGKKVAGFFIRNPRGGYGKLWNPLDDDGDALRLAVKVGLAIYPPAFNGGWEATASVKAADGPFVDESFHHDHNETTRRAIVRAAAEVGAGLRPFPTVEEIHQIAGTEAIP